MEAKAARSEDTSVAGLWQGQGPNVECGLVDEFKKPLIKRVLNWDLKTFPIIVIWNDTLFLS